MNKENMFEEFDLRLKELFDFLNEEKEKMERMNQTIAARKNRQLVKNH